MRWNASFLPSFLVSSLSLVTLTFPDDPPGQGRDLGPNAEKLDKVAKNWLEREEKQKTGWKGGRSFCCFVHYLRCICHDLIPN